MKKIAPILCFCLLVFACSEDKDDNQPSQANISLNFSQNWNEANLSSADFNSIKYTNANGEEMSVERLRYLISNVTLENSSNVQYIISDYNLINVGEDSGLTLDSEETIPTGTYNLSFTFGFNNDDNIDGAYLDLNSASWNVPMMLGGGYHFMQLEGKFINSSDIETGYAYHAIKAVDNSGVEPVFEDTFFTVNLGVITITNNATIEIKMNVAEWFKNPNQWDLNVLNNMLMPNFNAQIMINENGQSVFSLGEITQ